MSRLGRIVVLGFISVITIAAAGSFAAQATPAASAEEAGEMPDGCTAFKEAKCDMCHSIETLGIERTSTSDKMMAADLSDVGDKHDAAWIVAYLKKEETLDDEEHKKTFKGTDEEAQKIADWLATLKMAE